MIGKTVTLLIGVLLLQGECCSLSEFSELSLSFPLSSSVLFSATKGLIDGMCKEVIQDMLLTHTKHFASINEIEALLLQHSAVFKFAMYEKIAHILDINIHPTEIEANPMLKDLFTYNYYKILTFK